jgi:hypothetical protein
MANPNPPRVLSPDEIELLKKYRDLTMPAARLAGLDDFAKWLFTSVTVIGSLAAAFSTSAIKTFDTCSAAAFFVAIFLTGVSLFLAVCLRAVEPAKANWQNLEDMLAKNETALRTKQTFARGSGAAFALAVLAAGCAPLLSLACRPAVQNALSYSFGKDGIKASASFTQPPQTLSEIRIISQEPSKETVIAAQRSAAGADSAVKLEASGSLPVTSTGVRIVVTCDASKNLQQEVTITINPAGGAASAATPMPRQLCASDQKQAGSSK